MTVSPGLRCSSARSQLRKSRTAACATRVTRIRLNVGAKTEPGKDAGPKRNIDIARPADAAWRRLAASYVQADWHDEVHEAAALLARLDQAGPKRADQLEDQVLGLRAFEAVAEELGVEADLELLALEGHRQRLARLADVGRLGGDLDRALGEAEPQRRVLLCQQAD